MLLGILSERYLLKTRKCIMALCQFKKHALCMLSLLLATALLGLAPPRSCAGDKSAGTCVAVRGVLFRRTDDAWKTIRANDPVPAGSLLIALFESTLKSANGAVEFKLSGDIGTHGDFPSFEAAATVYDNAQVDLDLKLERGTVILSNRKQTGSARVRLRIRDEPMDLELKQGARTALAITGRHAPGAANIARDNPPVFLFMFVDKGTAGFATKDQRFTLMAPPGPALLRWDNIDRQPAGEFIAKPAPAPTTAEKQQFEIMCSAAQRLQTEDPAAAAMKLTESNNTLDRLVGVTALGALDAVPKLLVALNDAMHADVRHEAIIVLRNWLGREPGQIKKFHDQLINDKKLTETQAKTGLSLLIGFDDAERAQPSTYAFLIEALNHRSLAVRELAHWHLIRLVRAGKDISYDASAPEPERQQAVARWRALIPAGHVPAAAKNRAQPTR